MRRAPLHPALAHFPVALWTLLPAWDIAALYRGDGPWWAIGFWTGAAGLALAVPAAASGILELRHLPRGFRAHGVLIAHIVLMAAATIWAGVGMVLRAGPGAPDTGRALPVTVVDAIVALLVLAGGWLGGRLVYRHGVGQMTDEHER